MRLLVVAVLACAACLCIGCGGEEQLDVDPRGGAADELDCIDRLALERDARAPLTRRSLLRRLASVIALQTGDYTVFVAGPGGPRTFFDQNVRVPVSVRASFVSWRQGYNTVNVVSHTAAARYIRAVLRCAGFTPRARTPDGTVWRPGRARSRIIIERRGILIAGQELSILREVAAATNSAEPAKGAAGWEALRRATGQAAGLSRRRSSCADFQVLQTVSRHQLELAVRLPANKRLGDVQGPRGVRLGPIDHSRGIATVRARVADAARAVIAFTGVPPWLPKPWRIACDP
jgi:hypothetical protein